MSPDLSKFGQRRFSFVTNVLWGKLNTRRWEYIAKYQIVRKKNTKNRKKRNSTFLNMFLREPFFFFFPLHSSIHDVYVRREHVLSGLSSTRFGGVPFTSDRFRFTLLVEFSALRINNLPTHKMFVYSWPTVRKNLNLLQTFTFYFSLSHGATHANSCCMSVCNLFFFFHFCPFSGKRNRFSLLAGKGSKEKWNTYSYTHDK